MLIDSFARPQARWLFAGALAVVLLASVVVATAPAQAASAELPSHVDAEQLVDLATPFAPVGDLNLDPALWSGFRILPPQLDDSSPTRWIGTQLFWQEIRPPSSNLLKLWRFFTDDSPRCWRGCLTSDG